ncbi:MAG: fumarylacetoacetase [Gemmatimonadaceae bacterium]
MTQRLDETHDAALRSWVASANDPRTDFPIQNLPLGVFRRRGSGESPRIGVAIGDRILDLALCARVGLLGGVDGMARFMVDDTLNRVMAEGREGARALRTSVVAILREESAAAWRESEITLAQREAEQLLPVHIGDYTDFYASIHHATNVGSMFRPENPLLPNYKYIPVGYHGRASSIALSGTPIRRPSGQTRDDANAPPSYGPSRRLDYEMEVGAFVGRGSPLGASIPLTRADDHLWGLCLVNDWSARDIQTWEYQPLGPFLAKNFATTISPWVVTLDALEPFRMPVPHRPPGDPAPLRHLFDSQSQQRGAFSLVVEVHLSTERMRADGIAPVRVSRGSFADMYWTLGQMLVHHTSNGCNMRPGDLIASGTVSGPDKDSRGCLLERTWRGTEPLELPSGEHRAFLENGDEVIMRGFAEREGFRRIGFGECRGMIVG